MGGGAAAPLPQLPGATHQAPPAGGCRWVGGGGIWVWKGIAGWSDCRPWPPSPARTPACLPALCPLQVSWLGAWALLLGFRDFKTEEHMHSGLPCLRPEEADMLGVVQLWARIVLAAEVRYCWCERQGFGQMPAAGLAQRHLIMPSPARLPHSTHCWLCPLVSPLQDLPQELTVEQAQSAACQPLVADMVTLLGRLKGLSHLEDAGVQQVGRGQGAGARTARGGAMGA